MKKSILYTILALFCILFFDKAFAQKISGTVYTKDDKNLKSPLPGVNVYWTGQSKGTVTDEKGGFELKATGITDKRLVFSFIGFLTDTIKIVGNEHLEILMNEDKKNLEGVTVQERNTAFVSKLNTRQVEVITQGEIYRAACCNLAESFETNASVDVVYSDAITGAKQIQLLGLSGIYSQIITENVPLVRGLGTTFGLNYIPGSWMESIQVSKGTSSVINGFESTTGQINVEYKKPSNSEKLFVNLYGNSNARFEANINGSHKFNDKLSTAVMGHYDVFKNKFDRNNDNFSDLPSLETYNLFNRWDYIVPNRYVSRFGIKFLEEDRQGGFNNFKKDQFTYDTTGIENLTKSYGIGIKTKRMEAFWKNGFMFPEKPYKSLALIVSAIRHDQEGTFGLNKYDGLENSFYSQLLYQSRIKNEKNKFTTGLSFQFNDYKEDYFRKDFNYLYETTGPDLDNIKDSLFTVTGYHDTHYNLDRTERIPGAFFEYTYNPIEVFSVIAGIRVDNHNKSGTFITPRLHVKYNINEFTTLRASAGKGYRTSNVFVENYSIMASQRVIHFVEELKQENAWNYGVNLSRELKLFSRNSELSLEFYRTDFINQVIADMDSIPSAIYFYNLDGKSYSNVAQVQWSFEPVKSLNVMLAYRYQDVKTTINGKLREKPFVNSYKVVATVSYATRFEKWKFDLTTQYLGPSRIPDTKKMPSFLQRKEHAPAYVNLLAQVTKRYKNWYFYVGGENLTNFIQKDPITEYIAPYHTHFDTSMVWGPLVGTTVYAGLRYVLK